MGISRCRIKSGNPIDDASTQRKVGAEYAAIFAARSGDVTVFKT